MPRECGDFITAYMSFTEDSEPPAIFRQWVSISCIASVLKRKCKWHWGMDIVYPNMYIVLVAPPGAARKGTSMKPGLALLRKVGVKLAPDVTTREAFLLKMKETEHIEVYDQQGTIDTHCSLTVYSPEFVVFLGMNRVFHSELADFFDCADYWENTTKNKGVDDLNGVWLNILGATTPSLIQASLPKESFEGGLASRIIFVYAEKKEKSIPFPSYDKRFMELLVNDLSHIHLLRGDFTATEEFMERYIPWYMSLEEGSGIDDPLFAGYNQRRATHLRKLCMIVNASRSDTMIIEAQDFDRALHILTEAERVMPHAFANVGRLDNLEVIKQVMVKITTAKEIDMRTLLNMFYKDCDFETMERIITTLEKRGFCQCVGGRIRYVPQKPT